MRHAGTDATDFHLRGPASRAVRKIHGARWTTHSTSAVTNPSTLFRAAHRSSPKLPRNLHQVYPYRAQAPDRDVRHLFECDAIAIVAKHAEVHQAEAPTDRDQSKNPHGHVDPAKMASRRAVDERTNSDDLVTWRRPITTDNCVCSPRYSMSGTRPAKRARPASNS
jgi:hypothetical protein